MSPSAPQPDYSSPIIQEFIEWYKGHRINGTKGLTDSPNCPFMPFPDLANYLKAENRTSQLLRALFSERPHQLSIEVLEKQFLRVFIILLLIGKGNYIKHFVQHNNLRDSQLPFLEKPVHFPTDPNDGAFWDSFSEKQFELCAHYFRHDDDVHTELEDPCILPVLSKELLANGGSAAIYKIKLHSHYDQLVPDGGSDEICGVRPANTYVLKTYNTKDAHTYFENEVNAFKNLTSKQGTSENLIQFLGSYKQGNTYNILLEYADRGTLEDFFQRERPPTLGDDIFMFWERLLHVIKALLSIHTTERPDGFCGPDILIGWHQDVKPRNILVLSGKSDNPYDVVFKLADLGLSHFKRTVKLDRSVVDGDRGGTKDYGAPECYRADEFLEQIKINVGPSIDIWSFGGVCSDAAVWVVLGLSGLTDYRGERQQEISDKGTSQDGSCFHDGKNVLTTVQNKHVRLLRNGEVRPGDHVTKPVLKQMVPWMLHKDPNERLDALWLYKISQNILEDVRSKLKGSDQLAAPKAVEAARPNISHLQGPPPHDPRYSMNPRMFEEPSFSKRTLTGRSDIWHEPSIGTSATGDPHHGNLLLLTSADQPHGARPLPHMNHASQEQTRTEALTPDKLMTGSGENLYQNASHPSYSPPIAPRDENLLGNAYIQHQRDGEFRPRRTESNPENNITDVRRNDQHSRTVLQNSVFGSPLDFGPENSIETSQAKGHETSRPIAPNTLDEQSSLPESPRLMPKPSAESAKAAAESSTQKKKLVRPSISFHEAEKIRVSRGVLPPESRSLLNDLKTRDHVFLIDDSKSMKNHWKDVISLFSVLAYFTKRIDSDGQEMYFTVSRERRTFRDTSPMIKFLEGMKQDSECNIDIRLQEILEMYQKNLERKDHGVFFSRKPKTVKPLSLYVFTNAVWPGSDATAPIEAMINKLRQLGFSKSQTGIQFIRFGQEADGIAKLKYLDSGLRRKYTKEWDIVDTEPFLGGNFLKMLLGHVSNWYDDDD